MKSLFSSQGTQVEDLRKALEAEIGESILYRMSGQFLSAEGLGPVPLGSWGLIVLTPTRLTFHHYSQPHPLFGGKDADLRFEVSRHQFVECTAQNQGFWAKLWSRTPDHVVLSGTGTQLRFELAASPQEFLAAWGTT